MRVSLCGLLSLAVRCCSITISGHALVSASRDYFFFPLSWWPSARLRKSRTEGQTAGREAAEVGFSTTMALRDELLKSIWHAFTALDVDQSGKVSKSQLKVNNSDSVCARARERETENDPYILHLFTVWLD